MYDVYEHQKNLSILKIDVIQHSHIQPMSDSIQFILSVACSQGKREYMEDTYCVTKVLDKHDLFCVFDGHGGIDVAELCAKRVGPILGNEIKKTFDMPIAIRQTFHTLDNLSERECNVCGSTAVLALIYKQRMWFANCGDAMAMVAWTSGDTEFMTQDHKVEYEAKRILAAGAQITYDDGCARINRMLNIARSIGDHHLKKYVIPNPYITSAPLAKVSYVVIASDGLWDVYTPTILAHEIEIMTKKCQRDGIEKKETIDYITKTLVENAYRRGSTDNITVIYLDLAKS